MPVARSGILWRRIFLLLLIAVVGAYFYNARKEFPHGGSTLGLTYGTIGFALILLEAFFGIRKRWYRSRFGTLEQWLQSHIYLGVLVLVILLFHTGGRFNGRIPRAARILAPIALPRGLTGAKPHVTLPRALHRPHRRGHAHPRRNRRRQRHHRRDPLRHRPADVDRGGERSDGGRDVGAAQPAREIDGPHRLGTFGRVSTHPR